MNQWQPDEAAEFRWACDAYVLNVQLSGTQRFKIADDLHDLYFDKEAAMMKQIEAGAIDTQPWITHRATSDAFVDEFPGWLAPDAGLIKGMLLFGAS